MTKFCTKVIQMGRPTSSTSVGGALRVVLAQQNHGPSETPSMSLSPRLSDVAISFEGNVPQILLLQLLGGHGGQCDLSDLIH